MIGGLAEWYARNERWWGGWFELGGRALGV